MKSAMRWHRSQSCVYRVALEDSWLARSSSSQSTRHSCCSLPSDGSWPGVVDFTLTSCGPSAVVNDDVFLHPWAIFIHYFYNRIALFLRYES